MTSRLVYAPKSWVFTKAQDGTLYNLSPYVVQGEVQRNINQVSSAAVTLRNPYRIFTSPQKGVAFHPMDPITIYLERLEGYPVRVFTGYLDTTPYYQLQPGTIQLQASCTLKRLLYTFFDPSLPYMVAFFEKYGWINTGSGTIISSSTITNQTQATKNNPTLKDGSLGKLLWALLFDVAQWSDTNIWIEPIPPGILQRMTQLMTSMQATEKTAAQYMTSFLSAIVGQGSQGGANPNPGAGGSGPSWKVKVSAESLGDTGCNGDPIVPDGYSELDNGGGSGSGTALGTLPCKTQMVITNPANNKSVTVPKIDNGGGSFGSSWAPFTGAASGLYPNTMSQLGVHSGDTVIFQRADGQPLQVKAGFGTQVNTPSTSGSTALGNFGNTVGTAVQQGSSAPSSGAGGYSNPIGSGATPNRIDMGVDYGGSGVPLYALGNGTIDNSGPGTGGWEPTWISLRLSDGPLSGHIVYYAEHIDSMVSTGQHVQAGQRIGTLNGGMEIGFAAGPGNSQPPIDTTGGGNQSTAAGKYMSDLIHQLGGPAGVPQGPIVGTFNGAPISGGASSSGSQGSTSGNSSAEAFVASLDFPSIEDSVTALILGGEGKGLMHDQALMPFVQQVAQASLRSFMSLPNGDFFAFYPDYFGEYGHHDPYWLIDDLEILSGTISLTDDALATHVYVVGDNMLIDVPGISQGTGNTELMNEMFSAGTISVFNAFLSEGVISGTGKNKKTAPTASNSGLADVMNAKEALDFIKRYGARPLVQNYPQVRSSIFEMLLAYQTFMTAWANQFLTPFTFTFMPELFPGGKVGFPTHGLQMYINQVTHSWDYESGFTTTAQLSSPSVFGNGNPNLPPNMVSAMAEPIQKQGGNQPPPAGEGVSSLASGIADEINPNAFFPVEF